MTAMDVTKIIGRKAEIKILREAWTSSVAELLVIYGRRRIGKTYLVRNVLLEKDNHMAVTGLKDGSMVDELEVFTKAFQETFYAGVSLQPIKDWKVAFELFTVEIKKLNKRKKFVLFLDEISWLASPKSGLLQALDHYWNTQWSLLPNLKVVLCGSAASWMLENLVHAKGGLHNRITREISLQPFSLAESEEYLQGLNIKLERDQILELFMAFGGVAHYLNQAIRGKSAAQIINTVCFSKNGMLRNEFEKLFPALFAHPEFHYSIFKVIARFRKGVTRTELIKKVGVPSGGGLNRRLRELEEAGFISHFVPYGNKKKEASYRVMDEYCNFYDQWIAHAPKGILMGSSPHYWEKKRGKPAWRSWAGYTFEGICLKHVERIQAALGIHCDCEIGTWRYPSPKGSKVQGAQVDLLFDRDDGIINLCEIKYCDDEFVIDKKYAAELEQKIDVFRNRTGTRKKIFLTLITTQGVAKNMYWKLVDSEVTLDSLF